MPEAEIRIPAGFTKLFLTGYDWNYRPSKQPQLSDGSCTGRVARPSAVRQRSTGRRGHSGHRADYDGWAQRCRAGPTTRCCRTSSEPSAGGQQCWRVVRHLGPAFISELRDPNPTTAVPGRVRRTGHAPPRRTQRAGQHGYAPTPVTHRRGSAQRRRRLLAPCQAEPQLTASPGVRPGLLEGSRATGGSTGSPAWTHRVTASREVILSAGTVNSPQLLSSQASASPTSCALPA